MSLLSESYFPPPRSWDALEGMAFDVFTQRLQNTQLRRYGRTGQAQHGVDIAGPTGEGRFVGIQCKNHPGASLSVQEIDAEIWKAESFSPPLSHYILVTSAPRDAIATSHVLVVSDQRRQMGQFTVEIFFWEDLYHEIARHPYLIRSHFPELMVSTAHTQPELKVTFPNGKDSAEVAANWTERPPIEHEKMKRTVGRDGRRVVAIIPPAFWHTPAKVAGTTLLRFRIQNQSSVEAKGVKVTLFLPEGCRPVLVDTAEIFYPNEKSKAIKKLDGTVEIRVKTLMHRPACITNDIHLEQVSKPLGCARNSRRKTSDASQKWLPLSYTCSCQQRF